MNDDRNAILGRWNVRFGRFEREYIFTGDGIVRWRDPFNDETSIGRWSLTPQTVYLSWEKSTIKESWNRPVKRTEQSGWIEASYRSGPFEAKKLDEADLPIAQDTSSDFVVAELFLTGLTTCSR